LSTITIGLTLRFSTTTFMRFADKQVHLQYLDMEAAIEHCTKGVGI